MSARGLGKALKRIWAWLLAPRKGRALRGY